MFVVRCWVFRWKSCAVVSTYLLFFFYFLETELNLLMIDFLVVLFGCRENGRYKLFIPSFSSGSRTKIFTSCNIKFQGRTGNYFGVTISKSKLKIFIYALLTRSSEIKLIIDEENMILFENMIINCVLEKILNQGF